MYFRTKIKRIIFVIKNKRTNRAISVLMTQNENFNVKQMLQNVSNFTEDMIAYLNSTYNKETWLEI